MKQKMDSKKIWQKACRLGRKADAADAVAKIDILNELAIAKADLAAAVTREATAAERQRALELYALCQNTAAGGAFVDYLEQGVDVAEAAGFIRATAKFLNHDKNVLGGIS